jgi:transcriptional regulator of acetoin/glycerol metabolism
MAKFEMTDSTLPIATRNERESSEDRWCLHAVFPVHAARLIPIPAHARLLIGREESCQVVVQSPHVSRAHAELIASAGELTIVDRESLNGAHVNGERVARQRLEVGDVLRVGDWLAIVARESASCRDNSGVEPVAAGFWAGPTLRRALRPLQAIAKTDLPIVLLGPTGAGKERAARAVHEWSGREGPFVAVNCAAIPTDLAEAELFGFRKGAFTGADRAGVGHLRAAHRGTLLLDEVSDLPLALQAKLLRAVEQNEVQPLGDSQATPIDVRILAASQLPLAEHVAAERFRADLRARLEGFVSELPALTDRREEIPALFVHLLARRLGSKPPELDPLLVERLLLHPWPGNVRELELLARRLLGLHGHESQLELRHLVGTGLEAASAQRDEAFSSERNLHLLVEGLRKYEGNLTKAAAIAGISRQRAYRLISERPDLDLSSFRAK